MQKLVKSFITNTRIFSSRFYSTVKTVPIQMATTVDKNLYILQNHTPVVPLDCTKAFEMLTSNEKNYAHRIARASFEGGLITFCQVSPEAPAIFAILHRVFSSESIDSLKQKAKELGWADEEITSLLVYAAGLYAEHGNYKGFGDSKIIPNVEQVKLRQLFEKSAAFEKDPSLLKLYNRIEHRIFSLEAKHLSLGFPEVGVTTYFSSNVTKKDTELVSRFLKENTLEGWNTRLEKRQEGTKTIYIIRLASAPQANNEILTKEFEGATFIVKNGDYGFILEKVIVELNNALDHVANENQRHMIEKYIQHFTTGDINAHKDGSRYWIKDVNPAVESYIGFIENYRDPDGFRSEFEGFVTAVNKETSRKFQILVNRAEELTERLPWGSDYEKDKFLKPDFTSLDVIGFAGSGLPAGINIPNYDEIRQNEGFKNVSLGNVISAIPKQKVEFLSAEDEALFKKLFVEAFEVQVGLHELLGHGSGKLLMRDENGKFNFDKEVVKDMLTGGEITSWYEPGETWGSKFGQLSSAYEECRAEAVGYFLCCYPDILKIFGFEGELAEDVKYVNWMNEIRAGLVALEYYLTDAGKWGQAHCCARYVLLRVVLAAGEGFVTIEEATDTEGKPDLKFRLDRTKIESVGKPAIAEFLKKLQYYKSTANSEAGSKFFNEWAAVGSKELRWREIVVARRKPRRVYVQPNTSIDSNGNVVLKTYPETFEGMIQSFVERYDSDSIDRMLKVWENDLPMFDL